MLRINILILYILYVRKLKLRQLNSYNYAVAEQGLNSDFNVCITHLISGISFRYLEKCLANSERKIHIC